MGENRFCNHCGKEISIVEVPGIMTALQIMQRKDLFCDEECQKNFVREFW